MDNVAPADFYTGIVALVYAPLRSSRPDAGLCSAFIQASGEPALELGCGDGDPMLELRGAGLQVEGLDSSIDMLTRLERKAAQLDLDVTVHHSTIEDMNLGKTYGSIYLADQTFNLLPDDDSARKALQRIRLHLDPGGTALIPLFVPEAVRPQDLGVVREHIDELGRILRVCETATERDEDARRQTTRLRFEVVAGESVQTTERPWTFHWWTQTAFQDLAVDAGLRVEAVLSSDGSTASHDATEFAVWLRRDDAP